MGLRKTLKRIGRAIPAIVETVPAVVEGVREVRRALGKPKEGRSSDPTPG
jgi:hypothetical protein